MSYVACVRPDKKAAKIAYKIMSTPKYHQTDSQQRPSKKLVREWFIDSQYRQ